tara:strand:- start:44 stop:493 length:450 start_codon:yes stop_codon:yes gene_type:complete
MTEYTILEQILGTIFAVLLIIFIIGKKLGVKWFSTLKMWHKGELKERWNKMKSMKEKEHTLVGWKEFPGYLFHPKMFISNDWPFTEWGEYDEKTNTQTWYKWVISDKKKAWNSLLHVGVGLLIKFLKLILLFMLGIILIGFLISLGNGV